LQPEPQLSLVTTTALEAQVQPCIMRCSVQPHHDQARVFPFLQFNDPTCLTVT
jgi:hypothetical protein